MERPSHIAFARHSSLSRTPWIGLAIALQLAGAWLFMHGLSTTIGNFIPHDIFVEPVKPDDLPRTPPPPLPPQTKVEIPHVPQPVFTVQPTEPTNGGITVSTGTQSSQTLTQPKPAGIERAAVGITATHTVPPYPPIARRLGAEGKVILRLTVGTDGRVTAAEIVTSAGREDLDQAARDWILAHWRYRPAMKDGNPAAAQILASVTYSLKNQ